ncbi:MAG: cyclic nucleotide-binding domain-containing protein [Desulfobacterales bacterium]|nr:cyclic nucleotide-binding domain-containing protein [Desulfobacterales bacterium]
MSCAEKNHLISDSIIRVVRKFMIFENLESRDIKRLLGAKVRGRDGRVRHMASMCHYKAGEEVIQDGVFDSRTFWVVQGAFEVIQEGNSMAVFDKPGQIFGEMSVLEGIPRTAIVRALTDGVCLRLDMWVLEALDNDPVADIVRKSFYQVILSRLEKTKEIVMSEKLRLEMQYAHILSFELRIREKSQQWQFDPI